jgi:hypothetical protein
MINEAFLLMEFFIKISDASRRSKDGAIAIIPGKSA